jgi:hypothetical protein
MLNLLQHLFWAGLFQYLYTATLIIAKAVIPAPYQVRGRLSRARNDKPYKTYVVMYNQGLIRPLNRYTLILKSIDSELDSGQGSG